MEKKAVRAPWFDEDFVPKPQVVEKLHTTGKAIARLVSLGRFPAPALRIGRVVLWRKAELEEFLQQQSAAAAQSA